MKLQILYTDIYFHSLMCHHAPVKANSAAPKHHTTEEALTTAILSDILTSF